MYSAITVGFVSFLLTFGYDFDSLLMLFRLIHSFDKAVISAVRYAEKLAHHGYWIFVFVTVYCFIFEFWSHFLPVRWRKSRSSSTSISSCAIRLSFSSSAVIGRLRWRPFAFGELPCLTFCSFRLCRFTKFFICSSLSPKCSAISRFVFHPEHFRFHFLYLCVPPWHNKSLLWFLFFHRRVFLSLSVFTGAVHSFAGISHCYGNV